MGAAVDEAALSDCIRETLDSHLRKHDGCENAAIVIGSPGPGRIALEVEGFAYELRLITPEDDVAELDAVFSAPSARRSITDPYSPIAAIEALTEGLGDLVHYQRHPLPHGATHPFQNDAVEAIADALLIAANIDRSFCISERPCDHSSRESLNELIAALGKFLGTV